MRVKEVKTLLGRIGNKENQFQGDRRLIIDIAFKFSRIAVDKKARSLKRAPKVQKKKLLQ